MQKLYKYQDDFLDLLDLGVSFPQKALDKIAILAVKLEYEIENGTINHPGLSRMFLLMMDMTRYGILPMDENEAKLRFQQYASKREALLALRKEYDEKFR